VFLSDVTKSVLEACVAGRIPKSVPVTKRDSDAVEKNRQIDPRLVQSRDGREVGAPPPEQDCTDKTNDQAADGADGCEHQTFR